ncbi:MAG: hypothetical protein WBE45_21335 [Terriglobales bacterium]|jgi:hypothetical protein
MSAAKVNTDSATDKMIDYAESLIKRSGITVIVDGDKRMRVKTALKSMSFDEVSNLIDRHVRAHQLRTGKIIVPPVEVKPVVREL